MSSVRSSGSQSARGPSPSARARAHEKKLREREQRRLELQGPGPGSYEPKHMRGDMDKLAGSCAFRTRTPRGNRRPDYTLRDITLGAPPRASRATRPRPLAGF